MAARNNADWYAMMFDVHGIPWKRSDIAFLATGTPPLYHSWITTLNPEATEDALLRLVVQNVQQSGFSIKDSFHCLNLNEYGLVELFSASWIVANNIRTVDTSNWVQITSTTDLLLWETAWKEGGSPTNQRQFPDAMLSRNDVVFWGRKSATGFDAGVIANVSSDCVGLSNCFGQKAFPAAASLCATVAMEQEPEIPVVGYERGDDLVTALDSGFEATGPLSVWVKQA